MDGRMDRWSDRWMDDLHVIEDGWMNDWTNRWKWQMNGLMKW